MRADFISTALRENAQVGYLSRVEGRRALWLKVMGGGMDVGWVDLAASRFDAPLTAWTSGGTGSGDGGDRDVRGDVERLVQQLQVVLDARERERTWYMQLELCAVALGRERWSIARLGGVRVVSVSSAGIAVVGKEDTYPPMPAVSTASLLPASRWTVDGVVDDSTNAEHGRRSVRIDEAPADGGLLIVSHPWWTALDAGAIDAAARTPEPARSLFGHDAGQSRSAMWLTPG